MKRFEGPDVVYKTILQFFKGVEQFKSRKGYFEFLFGEFECSRMPDVRELDRISPFFNDIIEDVQGFLKDMYVYWREVTDMDKVAWRFCYLCGLVGIAGDILRLGNEIRPWDDVKNIPLEKGYTPSDIRPGKHVAVMCWVIADRFRGIEATTIRHTFANPEMFHHEDVFKILNRASVFDANSLIFNMNVFVKHNGSVAQELEDLVNIVRDASWLN